MTDSSAATMVFFGLLAILFVFIAGDYFPSIIRPAKRKLPKWWGHLWFLGFAAIMFWLGIGHFLRKK